MKKETITESEAVAYLAKWCKWVDKQNLSKNTTKFLKAHPFLAPRDWDKKKP